MEYFVATQSIVRRIWSKSDTILFIFAGAAAEFSLNKAVDWLYFTGKLPADPLGRLFSTVRYAREIVFLEKSAALEAIGRINKIHGGVEKARGGKIPDWAYRDVLFMLIYYSIASYELLERKLTTEEKEELHDVFYRMGMEMGLKDLPADFAAWQTSREAHLQADLVASNFTADLFRQYRKHLGWWRYRLLIGAQQLVIPDTVKQLMGWSNIQWVRPLLVVYLFCRRLGWSRWLKSALMPPSYREQINNLDADPVKGPAI